MPQPQSTNTSRQSTMTRQSTTPRNVSSRSTDDQTNGKDQVGRRVVKEQHRRRSTGDNHTNGEQHRRSTGDNHTNGKDQVRIRRRVLKDQHRRRSTGDMETFPTILRVKSQSKSLQTPGLARSNSRQRVEFAFLEVREFPMILGDNPSCCDGPPVTIDWAHDPQTHFVLDVNTFEAMRGDRRTQKELLLSGNVREKSLINSGVSKLDIHKTVREVQKDQHRRMLSSQQQGMDNWIEATENLASGFKKIFAFSKKSTHEKSADQSCAAYPPSA